MDHVQQVKLLIDPSLWDMARETVEDTALSLMVMEAMVDQLNMEVRSAPMGFQEHWPMVTNSAQVMRIIRMQAHHKEIFKHKRCILGKEHFSPKNGNDRINKQRIIFIKAIALKALAGVALIGAAAALASNPVLLPISFVSGRRKRSETFTEEEQEIGRANTMQKCVTFA